MRDPAIGDTVRLSEAGKDLTRYWTTPRSPRAEPEFVRRGWCGQPFVVRQIQEAPSGKVYYRLHRLRINKKTGVTKTAGVMLVGREHIA